MNKEKLSVADGLSKPNFSEGELATLERFQGSNSNDSVLIKKIMIYYMDEMTNIMNIDPTGNVGLQTCARQEAYKVLSAMARTISPDVIEFSKKNETVKAINQWR